MKDQDLLSVIDIKPVQAKKNFPASTVIKRVFHTRTEFRIYPNGEVYPERTSSWFEDKIYMVKKKVKAKAKPVKKVKTRKVEEY